MTRLFAPDSRKLIAFISISILLWFFPIVTSSVYAAPFVNLGSFWLSLLVNLAAAYVAGCLLVRFWKRKKVVAVVVVAFVLLFIAIPKVSFYSAGDEGGVNEKYCECYGYKWGPSPQCCYSSVSYCQGPCLRNEWMQYWGLTDHASPEQAACESQGGAWDEPYPDRGHCLMLTIDGNEPCTDSSQCEGLCVGPDSTIGRCAEWDPLPRGCYDVLTNGTPGRLCID